MSYQMQIKQTAGSEIMQDRYQLLKNIFQPPD
jgi:hypothetical protein